MKKENRGELIHDALNLLDEDMIAQTDNLRRNPVGRKKRKLPLYRLAAAAASLCVLATGSYVWGIISNPLPEEKDNAPATKSEESVLESQFATEEISSGNMDYIEENEEDAKNELESMPPTSSSDVCQLKNNYIRVSVLTHELWVNAVSEEEALQQAVTIDTKYKQDIDKLVENMCTAGYVSTQKVSADKDVVYHLFFEKADKEVVHCRLLEDGYLYYEDRSEICLILDKDIYDTINGIIETHWERKE